VETQDLSLFDQLNSGVRFVDLRIGISSGKIRLYHSSYLLSSKAELVDIFWGMYYWLDLHPTETLLVSLKVDNGNNTIALRQQVYDLMTGGQSDYWVKNTTVGLPRATTTTKN
jgi:1-phosphatidylinositol phosphodiesterase